MNKNFGNLEGMIKDEFEAIDDRFNELELKLNLEGGMVGASPPVSRSRKKPKRRSKTKK